MKEKKIAGKIFTALFYLSFLYYVFWICYAFYSASEGIKTGWAMPAMSNGRVAYGVEGFFEAIGMGYVFTLLVCRYVPLYQVGYLIAKAVIRAKRKRALKDEMPTA